MEAELLNTATCSLVSERLSKVTLRFSRPRFLRIADSLTWVVAVAPFLLLLPAIPAFLSPETTAAGCWM